MAVGQRAVRACAGCAWLVLAAGCGRLGVDLVAPDADADAADADADLADWQRDAALPSDGAVSDAGGTRDAGSVDAATGDGGAALDAATVVDAAVWWADASAWWTDAGTVEGAMRSVAPGWAHTCAIDAAGALSCWGSDDSSALGGAGMDSTAPEPVLGGTPARGYIQVESGNGASCARDATGAVWCWGNNARGNLGVGDTDVRATPTRVLLPGPALEISMQYDVGCAVLLGYRLYCWGDNLEGQMGQDDAEPGDDALRPVQVPGADWAQVSAGQGHVCALRTSGALWCWGRNGFGELGQGGTEPVQIRKPVQVGSDSDWKAISAGQFQSCGIRDDGSLWCWGRNDEYQLGLGDTGGRATPTRVGSASDWMAVDMAGLSSCGLRHPGTLWCWGRNQEGQAGLPYDPSPIPEPTQSGTVASWTEVSTGWMHTCARRSDRTLWCTGANDEGRVGDGTTTRPYQWVQVQGFP